MKPIKKIDEQKTADGLLQLFKRGDSEYIIKLDNQILMNSHLSLTEQVLAVEACNIIKSIKSPKVMVSGLGMGYTLKAALENLPENAEVTVVELNPVISKWCREYLSEINNSALNDSRVTLIDGDAKETILIASTSKSMAFDAIILDMYEGTTEANRDPFHPFYGLDALKTTRDALAKKGVLSVWTEGEDRGFESRLARAGFKVRVNNSGKGGPRHFVYLGIK
ncbi:MAG: spermidine synthase [Deltaproteobacteria bacterium]|nr:spermidine synthase [Deltaproteobacteria bacterium]